MWLRVFGVFNGHLKSQQRDCHAYTRNLSSAFNPSRLAPVDTHMVHTLIETDAIHWSGGQPFTVGRIGVRCLAQGHLEALQLMFYTFHSDMSGKVVKKSHMLLFQYLSFR